MRTVSHLEGGVVSEIFVRDGDLVEAGEKLVLIELAPSQINPEEIRAQLDGLLLRRARLTAEARNLVPVWPEEVVNRRPSIALAEMESYESRRAEIETSIAVLQQQVEQRRLEIREFETQLASLEAELALATEKFNTSADLLRDALVTRLAYLEDERLMEQLQGQVSTIKVSIPRAQATLAEAQKRIEETRLQYRREVQSELGEAEVAVARIEQTLAEAERQELRTTITNPIDGVINGLVVRSVGDVVRGGDPLMTIVPVGDAIVVEAHLDPIDRGYVSVGQDATAKVTSYDFVRYGGLAGKVTFIAADKDLDDSGAPYFLVVVETEKSYLGSENSPLPVTPGMQAMVDIKTGSKSVLEYQICPVLKIQYEAFRER